MNIVNFGCRLNASESERIFNFINKLDVSGNYTIINTCAVTAEAERKLRQTIRKLFIENPNVKIILTGCASELTPSIYLKMSGVIGIVSNELKLSIDEYRKFLKTNENKSSPKTNNILKEKVRGFLQIQNGCDEKCTYCVVRITRGKSICLDKDDIVNQAKILIQKGQNEIVLTGVNISSYSGYSYKENLAFLIKYILKNVPELRRLRLSSLDPSDINQDLIDIIHNEDKLMPHFHESIQSGDNMILKRMLRRHSREEVIEKNLKILEKRPDSIFGADIIVGFPTETDEMFDNTKKLLTEANISLIHSFPYSKRPQTSAALMPQINNIIKLQRVQELRKLSKTILNKKMQGFVGKHFIIYAEEEHKAKTNTFLPVYSLTPLTIGKEHIFFCSYCEKNILIGHTS